MFELSNGAKLSVLFAAAMVATGIVVTSSIGSKISSARRIKQNLQMMSSSPELASALEEGYRIGVVEVEYPFKQGREDFPTTLANDACLLSAVNCVREQLFVCVRGINPNSGPGVARAYLAELYVQLWDVACLCDKMLLDVRVVTSFHPSAVSKASLLELPDLEVFISTKAHDILATNNKRAEQGKAALKFVHIKEAEQFWDKGFYFCEDPAAQIPLFSQVACGGTFDNLHNGHKKLLTLASSITAPEGMLTVGVTSDMMLTKKKFGEYIGTIQERIEHVEEFLQSICPGIQTRVCEITNPFGPPAVEGQYEAIVVSSETVNGGLKINEIRESKGLKPLSIIVTRRTEATSLSSTSIREQMHKRKVNENTSGIV